MVAPKWTCDAWCYPSCAKDQIFNYYLRHFKCWLRRIGREAATVFDNFDELPTFELWRNPVTESARASEALHDVSRRCETDYLFHCSGAPALVDDGKQLIDGGITPERRLWLLYHYHSLTDVRGDTNYTIVESLVSVTRPEANNVALCVGFDWLRGDSLSRLSFEGDEARIQASVLSKDNWRALHQINIPT